MDKESKQRLPAACWQMPVTYDVAGRVDGVASRGRARGREERMRRKDREIVDIDAIDGIVAEAKIARLGLFDEGYPYVVPVHYGYEWLNRDDEDARRLVFYIHGAREGHKLDLIRENPHVCVELDCDGGIIAGKVACDYGASYASVIGRGTAEILEDSDEKAHGLALLMREQVGKDFSFTPAMTRAVSIIRVTVDGRMLTAKSRPRPEA